MSIQTVFELSKDRNIASNLKLIRFPETDLSMCGIRLILKPVIAYNQQLASVAV